MSPLMSTSMTHEPLNVAPLRLTILNLASFRSTPLNCARVSSTLSKRASLMSSKLNAAMRHLRRPAVDPNRRSPARSRLAATG